MLFGVMQPPAPPRQSSRKFARSQRREMTRAETMLWGALRGRRLREFKFRRQAPIGPYCADFLCLEKRLIVEADGRTHESDEARARDAARDEWLRREGFRVLRFQDDAVIGGLDLVIEKKNIESAAPPPSPTKLGKVSSRSDDGWGVESKAEK